MKKDEFVSKSNFILILIIVILVTFIITREFSKKDFSMNHIFTQEIQDPSNLNQPQIITKEKNLSGKDGNEADPYEKEQVKNTILKNAKTIQECYSKWLESPHESEKASIKVDWTILPNGKVQKPQIVESTAELMNNCLIDKVQNLEFPYPPEAKAFYVVHKFNFDTEKNLEKLKKERDEMEKKFNPIKQ